MIPHATLHIRLAAGQIQPKQGSIAANVFTGGPNTLLNWLESQLGLQPPNIRVAERITQYATALESVKESVISESMAVDRWATATELLRRRDELLLADWDTCLQSFWLYVFRSLAFCGEHGSIGKSRWEG